MNGRRAVLVVPEIPTPPRCGNAWRDLQQIDVLRRLGFAAHVVAARPRWDLTEAEETAAAGALPGPVSYLSRERGESAEPLLATLARKVSYLARPTVHPFGWWLPRTLTPAIARLGGGAGDVLVLRSILVHEIPALRGVWPGRIVVDCHDSDVDLARELLRTVRGAARLGPWANLVGVRRAMRHGLPLADEVWAVSPEDVARLIATAPGARVLMVPSGMDPAGAAPAAQPGVDGRALLVANFGYGPNARGAEWLLRAVWPALRATVPTATLACVGARMPLDLARAAAASPGVEVCGQLADLAPRLREAAVVLAPILEGGGTRLKVVEAWSQGKAVVATSKAVEGLPASTGAVAIADEPEVFAARLGALLTDAAARRAMGSRALALFGAQLTWDVAMRAVGAGSVIAGAPSAPAVATR